MHITLLNEAATIAFGQRLATLCQPPLVMYLQGEIGAGKTTLIRALLRSLGVQDAIKSPTFSLIEPYKIDHWHLYHVDLYRLSAPEELEYVGLTDYMTADSVCCIEWPERAERFLPVPDLTVKLTFLAEGRALELISGTTRGKALVAKLQKNIR